MRFLVESGRQTSALRRLKPLEKVAELRYLTIRKCLHGKDVSVLSVFGYLFFIQSFHAASSLLQFRSLDAIVSLQFVQIALALLEVPGNIQDRDPVVPFHEQKCFKLCRS